MPKFREIMTQFQEKKPGQIAERKYRWILFHRTLLATARGPTSTTAIDWHLKVKDIECDVSLTKYYCITVSMQKMSSIHKLNLKILRILGPNELNDHFHF